MSVRRNAISCVVWTLIAFSPATISGQQPSRDEPEPYVAALLPADEAWRITLEAPPAAGGALDDRHVYVPVRSVTVAGPEGSPTEVPASDSLRAFDRETGVIRWISAIATDIPPLASGGLLFVATGTGIQALSALTGVRQWHIPLESRVRAPMLVRGNRIVALTEPDRLVAVDLDTRQVAWRRPIGESGPVRMTADDVSVYLTTAGSRVLGVRLTDGTVAWERTIEGTPSEPALGKNRVFVGSTTRSLWALDPRSGRVEWMWPGRMFGGDVIGAAAEDDLVYVAALDNTLRALKRGNGNQVWRVDITTRPVAPPRAFFGTVVVAGLSPSVLTFAGKDGAAVSSWSAPESAELLGPPLIDEHLKPFRVAMAVITRDGVVVALRPTAMTFKEPAAAAPLPALPGRPLPLDRLPAAIEQRLQAQPPAVPLLTSPLDGRFNELPGAPLPVEPSPR